MDAAGYSVRCSRAGAIGFVSKAGGIDELLTSVQIALAGYTLFPTDQHSSVDISLRFLPESDVLEALSGRELEVLRYLAKGCRVRDIAREMLLSEKTISTYKSRLIDKLQLSNFVELIDFAKRNGLV